MVVIGAGSIGAMTLWQLSQLTPTKIVGLDAYPRVNLRASYAGESRLFRTAVKEGPVFNEHADTSIKLWRELETISGRPMLHQCGALSIGPPDFEPMRVTAQVADEHRIPHEVLTDETLHTRYPQFSSDPDDIGILDVRGGVLRSEVAVSAAQDAAEANGARLYFNTAVTELASRADGVEITTPRGRFHTQRVIVAAGSWTPILLPQLQPYIVARPIGLTWAMPRNPADFRPDVFPAFMRDQVAADGAVTHWYGVPSLDGYSIKIGVETEPRRSVISLGEKLEEYSPERLAQIGTLAQECIPALVPALVRHSMHHDSFASNQFPIFDRLEDDQRILYATGMHGNAFKFSPSYGAMLAAMAIGGSSGLWRNEFGLTQHERFTTN